MITPNEVAGLIERLRGWANLIPKGMATIDDRHTLIKSADMLERLSSPDHKVTVASLYGYEAGLEEGRRLSPTEATEPRVERAVIVCPQCEGEGGYPDGVDEDACHTDCTRCGGNGWIVDLAALSSAISNAEAEDSGEVVQAGAKEPWEVLRDIVTPSPFSHNKAAWSIMLGLIQRDHRLAARQSPDSLVEAAWTHVKHPPAHGGHYAVGGYVTTSLGRGFERAFATGIKTLNGPEWSHCDPDKAYIPIEYWFELPGHPELASLSKSPSDGEGA